jgi:hypothetical protein
MKLYKKGLLVGTMFTQTQEEQKVLINMELENDEKVGDENLISHKATTTLASIMVQPKSQLQLHGQVMSQQSTHTMTNVQLVMR